MTSPLPTRLLLPLAALLALVGALVAAGCGGGDGGGGTTATTASSVDPARVAAVRAAAEAATGLVLTEAPVPDAARAAGVGALLTSGPDSRDGQRLVLAVADGDRRIDVPEDVKADLGRLAGIDVDATSSPLGWATRAAKGAGDPVYFIYWAEASSEEALDAIDRKDELEQALAPLGYTP